MATSPSIDLASMETRTLTVEDTCREMKRLNSKAVALQMLTGDSSIDTMPKYVGFTTTTFCNLSCPHCWTHGTPERRQIYNSKRWRPELLGRLASESLPTAEEFSLTLSGEPLATPGLLGQLNHIAQYGAKLTMGTNATLLRMPMLTGFLPIASTISISLDGATKHTVERIRKGTDFARILTNIRLLTRTCELLPPAIRPGVQLGCVVMGSNIQEMPQVVRMAHALKIDTVVFSSIIVHFDLANESVARHRELFQAKLLEAREESARLNVRVVNLISENELKGAVEEAGTQSGRMIIEEWPADYNPGMTSYDDYLDHAQIEAQAKEIMRCIGNRRQALSAEASPEMTQDLIRMREMLQQGMNRHPLQTLQSTVGTQPEFRYCDYLYKKTFVGIEGQIYPCCSAHPARPILGSVHKQSVRAVWNGDAYWNFRRKFQSPEMPECCRNCSWVTSLKSADILKELAV